MKNFDFSFLSENTTVLCQEYFKTFRSSHTGTTYYPTIKEFFTFCEKQDIADVSYDDCKKYMYYIQNLCTDKKIKEAFVCAKRKHISGFFSYIAKNKKSFLGIPEDFRNYFYDISSPYKINEEINFNQVITLSDIDKLTGYLMKHDMMCMAAVMVSFKMFLRGSEFITLKFSDIFVTDECNALLRVVNKTNETYRYLPMSSDIYTFLTEQWLPVARSEYIFPKEDRTISIRMLRYRLKKACNVLNIGPYSFNDLRNSGISYAVSQGASVKLVANAINLKSPSHVNRLSSLSDIHFTDASSYVNITFTGKRN